MVFILDRRTHGTQHVLGRAEGAGDMASLQGPALLAYDDAIFTPENFEGLFSFGRGSKSADPTKTGKFGLGFWLDASLTAGSRRCTT